MREPSRFAWPDGIRAAVSLTFDDARESQLIHGVPILDRHDVKATFYVSLSVADQRLDDWRRAAGGGHEIGNHSVNHVCSGNFCWGSTLTLEDYTLQRMEEDILAAQKGIEDRLGLSPRTFAYPCGQSFVGRGEQCRSYTPIVARHFIAGRRFRDETFNDPSFCDLARLAGTEGDGLSFEQLRTIIDQAAAEGAWVVLAMHDVGLDRPRQVISTDTLEQLCSHCKDPANGIWIDTTEHIADFIHRTRSQS